MDEARNLLSGGWGKGTREKKRVWGGGVEGRERVREGERKTEEDRRGERNEREIYAFFLPTPYPRNSPEVLVPEPKPPELVNPLRAVDSIC